ncbi:capsid [uncultured virus]|uniref:Capsid n=1 Tax=uncultured virus TaxID=340016 RepID=A0A2K9LT19_9VIRU|nr:capsid [uncultured virus]
MSSRKGFLRASKRMGSAKLRALPRKGASTQDRLRVKRAAQAMSRRTMPVRAAMILRGSSENHTFDPASNGVTYNCTSDAAVAVSATGYVTAAASAIVLNQVPQGTSSITRLGRRILMKNLLVRGAVAASNVIQVTQPVRVVLVYLPSMDRNVTTMPPHNVIWTAQSPYALRQITDNMDFKIIRQWDCIIGGDRDSASTGQEVFWINEMVNLGGLETVWSSTNTNGSFDDMDKGGLCLYFQSLAVNANPITANFHCRLYFDE